MKSPLLRAGALLFSMLFSPACLSFHRGPMPGEPPHATYLSVADARVRYADVGFPERKEAVVLLHGFASALETWNAVRPRLEPHHRLLLLDLKGFGWTDRPPGDYSPAAQADLVLSLMSARGIERAHVVAHSWGASVALAMALRAPERVKKLALYDAWVFEEQLPSTFAWARAPYMGEFLFAAFYKERPEEKIALAFHDKKTYVTEAFVEEVSRALDRPGTVAAALAAVRGQRFLEMQGRYRNVVHDTLLLWGAEDEVTLPVFGERLHTLLPNSRLMVYPACGHFPMLEAAAASSRDLASFLGEGP